MSTSSAIQGQRHLVVVVGAGPAGMSVANLMSKAGHEVVILNRDIKFGGLAEYGIFPSKLKLRGGLRKSYWDIVERPNVHYFGNVTVGNGKALTVDELRGLGASALIFATGAQGTKTIGVEGETATGVYHAKDVVYHFNRLPEFSERPFDMGRHVAVIGVGDVMVDIAHWLIRYKGVEQVTAIARRGPLERKYNPKEIRAVCANIDQSALREELGRIRSRLEGIGQEPDKILKEMTEEFTKCEPKVSDTKMGFRFLASPKRVLTDGHNRVCALEMEDNRLEPKGQDTAAVGLKQYYEFPCDSVVFAVGDRVDETVGLPYKNGVFITNPKPSGNDPDDALFQAYDEGSGKIVEGVFLTGWARKASEGLVGIAKRDGEWCAEVLTRYLESQPLREADVIEQVLHRIRQLFAARKTQVVRASDLRVLETAEKSCPEAKDCIGEFKFASTQAMLQEIQRRQALKPASV
ncbi:MAG TPA: FAD-dependent oxidoreductase [Nitrospiraceae bacterium]|jgi:ferredoxin--NADP+ reductase|nr:FAD-dependent oxidoreductase [Nitrospiraceae bacterium]